MKVFVVVMFCLFILGAFAKVVSLNKDEYPRKVKKNVDAIALLIDMVFMVWIAVLLF